MTHQTQRRESVGVQRVSADGVACTRRACKVHVRRGEGNAAHVYPPGVIVGADVAAVGLGQAPISRTGRRNCGVVGVVGVGDGVGRDAAAVEVAAAVLGVAGGAPGEALAGVEVLLLPAHGAPASGGVGCIQHGITAERASTVKPVPLDGDIRRALID